MIPTQRAVLLVSENLLEAGQTVWDHRRALGRLDPEVHVVRGGRFLTAAEAAPLVPWFAGPSFEGTFFDALSENRVSLVLPLLDDTNGSVQGLLEFLGVAYAGCGMTSAILAHDRDHSKAVLASLGLPSAEPGPGSLWVSVAGNEDLLTAAEGPPDPEAEAFACRVYHGLGMGGWASVELVRLAGGLHWRSVRVLPDLRPQGSFVTALAARGLDFEALLTKVLRWGQGRHDAERSLKNHFKDGI